MFKSGDKATWSGCAFSMPVGDMCRQAYPVTVKGSRMITLPNGSDAYWVTIQFEDGFEREVMEWTLTADAK